MMEACDLDAVEARRLIGAKELSPVELLESCIARIEMVNPAVNAVVATCYDRARQEARAATDALLRGDPLPPLHGLPVGIKDLSHTEGLVTTYGSPLYKDFVPDRDERIVAALRRAGAIVLGKTNTPEFGAGGNTTNAVYGATRNPFDVARTCGGSSGGSAVALATGMLPLCSGSDTGGSLRKPATYCGVAAIRPTAGVVASDRRMIGLSNYSVQGPMARTVSDVGLMLSAMAGGDNIDPLSYPHDPAAFRSLPEVDLAGLRVAVSEDLGFAPMDDGLRAVFRERLDLFRSAFAACEARDPDLKAAIDVFWILRGVYFIATQKERYDEHKDQLGTNIVSNVEAGLKMTMEEVGWAHAENVRLYRNFQKFMEGVDLLICPGTAVPPFPIDQRYPTEVNGRKMANYLQASGITSGFTLTGHPVVALPCGYDGTGTPFGIQIVGHRHADRFLLGAAQALERLFATDPRLARPVPNLEMLKT